MPPTVVDDTTYSKAVSSKINSFKCNLITWYVYRDVNVWVGMFPNQNCN